LEEVSAKLEGQKNQTARVTALDEPEKNASMLRFRAKESAVGVQPPEYERIKVLSSWAGNGGV